MELFSPTAGYYHTTEEVNGKVPGLFTALPGNLPEKPNNTGKISTIEVAVDSCIKIVIANDHCANTY